jgi:hypothetical protein
MTHDHGHTPPGGYRWGAELLSIAGHEVEALSAEPLCLCRFTRHVRKVDSRRVCRPAAPAKLKILRKRSGNR